MKNAARRWSCWTLLGMSLWGASAARAIDIKISVDNPQNFPAFDPDGTGLNTVSQAAAQIWEKLRPGSDTYDINIHWEDWGDDAELGIANGLDNSIRMNSAYDWFIDETPLVNEEFAPFESLFYRDASSSEKSDWFKGQVPDMLEYSHSAWAWGNGPAFGKHDLLTVVLHEIGHLTGVGWNALSPDISLSQFWLGNRQGVKVERRNEAHIDPENALMDPDIGASLRALPSALDVMVSASEKGDGDVNLDRIDYIGNILNPSNVFIDPYAWVGGNFPGVGEQAYIRNHETVLHLGGTASIDNLTLTDYGDLVVQAGTVEANNLVINYNGTLVIESGASVEVDNLTVGFDGLVELNGGTLNGEVVVTQDVGTISGHGELHVTELLDNNGTIEGRDGTLEITTGNLVDVELDGTSGNGWLVAKEGSIANHALDIEFEGTMQIYEGQFISTDYYLGFQVESNLEFKALVGGKAQLIGAANGIGLQGNVSVANGAEAVIRAGSINVSILENDKIVNIASAGSLSLQGEINYNAADGGIVGGGTLHQDGNAKVNGDFTIAVETYNWDGNDESAPTNMEIGGGRTFTIESSSIDPNDEKYDGKVTVGEEATLAVHAGNGFIPTWKLGANGVIELHDQARVEGSAVRSFGTIAAAGGTSEIATNVTLEEGSTVTIAPKGAIEFSGVTTIYAGGAVVGQKDLLSPTTFTQNSNGLVVKDSTIDVTYFEWSKNGFNDKTTTLMDGHRLTIHAGKIGTPASPDFPNGTEGFGDTLDINSAALEVHVGSDAGVDLPAYWSIQTKGILNLNPTSHGLPTVEGSLLINNGLVQGTGIFFNEFLHQGTIEVGRENGIGMLQFASFFTQTKEGILNIELGGIGAGSGFDFLLAEEKFFLDGMLNVSLLAGYHPNPGDSFRIIDGTTGGGRVGTFADVTLPGGMWNVIYGDDFVDLRFEAVPEMGSVVLVGVSLAIGVSCRRRWRVSTQGAMR